MEDRRRTSDLSIDLYAPTNLRSHNGSTLYLEKKSQQGRRQGDGGLKIILAQENENLRNQNEHLFQKYQKMKSQEKKYAEIKTKKEKYKKLYW